VATLLDPSESPVAPSDPGVNPHPVGVEAAPATGRQPVLRCSGLVRTFGKRRAVDGVGFTIAPGETYGLLGPNGAGKTTTISMVCGILRRDAGDVWLDGVALGTDAAAVKGAIGYVPQDLAIYPDLSARENLRFFGHLYGMPGPRLARRIDEVLEVVDLADRAKERTEHFSGGMKRRLNIAIGLLHEPRLLVLDEPTVGVDPQSRNAILASVEALSAAGMGILYTTHYMEEAERLCDRVGIIDEGKIIAEGSRRELVALVGELDKVTLAAEGDLRAVAAEVSGLAEVRKVTIHEGGLDLLVPDSRLALPRILEATTRDGTKVRSVEVAEPDLEAVFLHLTGKGLRD
jgi:ABC-2 type transport system ATP-binding protein